MGTYMTFQNREEAAEMLCEKLEKFRGLNPLVLGIPRGAIPMAEIVARNLDGEMGAVLVRKIPSPWNSEMAVGAVGLSGKIYRVPFFNEMDVSEEDLHAAAEEQMDVLKQRKKRFHLQELNCQGRVVILVDDGIATGASAIAAIMEIREKNPLKLIVAAPTIARSTADELRPLVDELVSLMEPEHFYSVSQYYSDFTQVTDDEVAHIFDKHQRRKPPTSSARI